MGLYWLSEVKLELNIKSCHGIPPRHASTFCGASAQLCMLALVTRHGLGVSDWALCSGLLVVHIYILGDMHN